MKYLLAAMLFFALLALAVGQDGTNTVTVTKATQPVQTVQTVQAVQAVQAVPVTKEVVVQQQQQPTTFTQVATNQFPVHGGTLLISGQISSASSLHAFWLTFL